ncbi:MAG: hypothetical protein RJA70_2813 [Pseudomonadota bacterium]|jgi:hypothetical protein
MSSVSRVSSALIHYPVVGRDEQLVTAAITNIDLHDISRSTHTFGLNAMYVVHPVDAQRLLASRIQEHWVKGSGGLRIPDRKPALSCIRIVESIDAMLAELGDGAELWTTSAKPISEKALSFGAARSRLTEPGPPVVLCFGTSWGLAQSVHERASVHLEPIRSPRADGYNHLSVRAAAAILFDRLLGVG